MATQATASKLTAQPGRERTATYFGLTVQVLDRMEQCSLIRYRDWELVVSTEDLQGRRAMQPAASS
jgi:hypothetical protein